MIVVSNSSSLISLGKLGMLFLLKKLYGRVIISQAVYEEVVVRGLEENHKEASQVVILIENGTICIENVEAEEDVLNDTLGRGEIETIIYASGKRADLILMDDLRARIEARKKNLKVKGTIGVLYDAYCKDFLDWDNFQIVLQEIVSRKDIWIHEELCKEVLAKARMVNKYQV